MQETSKKIKKLVRLLNEKAMEGDRKRHPKVIIFVKDRVVAEYLHKILKAMLEKSKKPENYKNHQLLEKGYYVAVAMSPKGKNLLNRAYNSLKGKPQNAGKDESMMSSDLEKSTSIDSGDAGIQEFRTMLESDGSNSIAKVS